MCVMATLIVATVVYNTVFARFLFAGAIDQHIPVRWGKSEPQPCPRQRYHPPGQ